MVKLTPEEKVLMLVYNRKLKKQNGMYFYEDHDMQCNIPVSGTKLKALHQADYMDAEYKTLTKAGRDIVAAAIKKTIEEKNG